MFFVRSQKGQQEMFTFTAGITFQPQLFGWKIQFEAFVCFCKIAADLSAVFIVTKLPGVLYGCGIKGNKGNFRHVTQTKKLFQENSVCAYKHGITGSRDQGTIIKA